MIRAVTANVESTLDDAAAGRCLAAALDLDPDLVALQEWRLDRLPLLRGSGTVRLAGTPARLPSRRPGGARLTWVAGLLGDGVLGLRADRFCVVRHRERLLSTPWSADPGTRRPPVLPPRWATVVEATDRTADGVTGGRLGIVVFHLVPGAQRAGRYRVDRPRTVRQHSREVRSLQRIVSDLGRRCSSVWALGDSNFHGLRLDGLASAWADRPGCEGTLGSYRRIDDVFGPGSPEGLEVFVTESDHRMVMAERG